MLSQSVLITVLWSRVKLNINIKSTVNASNKNLFIYLGTQVWSEVNQAVLDYENRESTPKLAKLLKLLLWAQNELDQKKVKYPKMTDLSTGTIEDPK